MYSLGTSYHPKKGPSHNFVNRAFFQPKLTIGAVNDVYEQEADAVAEKVMRMTDTETLQAKPLPLVIQRNCAACAEEELKG
ncbi:hypothetical protein D3C80_2028510 [compost metagenome]